MIKRIANIPVLVLLSTLFNACESNVDEVYTRIFHPANQQLQPSFNSTQWSPDDIVTTLISLHKHSPLHIHLLFDEANTDLAHSISNQFSSQLSGLMMFQYDGSMSTLNLMLKSVSKSTILIPLCRGDTILEIFTTIKLQRMESHFVRWLLILEEVVESYEVMLGIEPILHEGTIISVIIKGINDSFNVYSAYVDPDNVMRFHDSGLWNGNKIGQRIQTFYSLVMTHDQSLYRDMRGRMIEISVMSASPYFVVSEKAEDGTVQPLSGIDYGILKALSETLNFTYRMTRPPDMTWGYPQPDGTVTGMIGVVARREAQMAICGIAVNHKRIQVVDFTYPTYSGFLSLFSRAPKERNRALAVLSPFTFEVWLCIFLTTILIGPVVKIQSKITDHYQEKDSSLEIEKYLFNMFRNLVIQGNLINTSQWSQRIIFFSWYLFCLIVAALYSGTLTAVLAIPSFEKPINYLTDLPRAYQDGFSMTVLGDTTNEYIFKEATTGIYKEVWELFDHEDRSNSFVSSSAQGLKMVLDRKSVHICPLITGIITIASYGSHRFHISKERFYPQSDGLVIQKGSPMMPTMDLVSMYLIQSGLVYKWETDELTRMTSFVESDEDASSSIVITITHMQAAFFILAFGFLSSLLVLIGEKCIHRMDISFKL